MTLPQKTPRGVFKATKPQLNKTFFKHSHAPLQSNLRPLHCKRGTDIQGQWLPSLLYDPGSGEGFFSLLLTAPP